MRRTAEPFADRREAGRFLAARLDEYAKKDPVCAGLPRGGVVVAAEVACALGAAIDVIVAGKLRSPGNPELAIGAVTEDGEVYLNKEIISYLGVSRHYLEQEKADRLRVVRAKLSRYRQVIAKTPFSGRSVILIDDGLATGSTMIAAVQAAHAAGAAEIIVAVPGGPADTVERIKAMPEITGVVCPVIPDDFMAVSQLYADFSQVEDDDVVEILKGFALRRMASGPG